MLSEIWDNNGPVNDLLFIGTQPFPEPKWTPQQGLYNNKDLWYSHSDMQCQASNGSIKFEFGAIDLASNLPGSRLL